MPCHSLTHLPLRTIHRGYTRFVILTGLVLVILAAAPARCAEPGWADSVLKRGAERATSRQTPIVDRPYRPLHVYGNTVRRINYRGRILPNAADAQMTAQLLRNAMQVAWLSEPSELRDKS